MFHQAQIGLFCESKTNGICHKYILHNAGLIITNTIRIRGFSLANQSVHFHMFQSAELRIIDKEIYCFRSVFPNQVLVLLTVVGMRLIAVENSVVLITQVH